MWKRESDRVGDLNDPTGIRQKFVTNFYWDFIRYVFFRIGTQHPETLKQI